MRHAYALLQEVSAIERVQEIRANWRGEAVELAVAFKPAFDQWQQLITRHKGSMVYLVFLEIQGTKGGRRALEEDNEVLILGREPLYFAHNAFDILSN